MDWGRKNDRFTSAAAAARNPGSLQIGDIATWKSNGKSHVGLVTGVNKDGTFNTIEGNTSDKVARRTHSFNDRGLTGFVRATKTELSGKTSTTAPGKSSTASSSAAGSKSAASSSKGSTGSTSSSGGSASSKSSSSDSGKK